MMTEFIRWISNGQTDIEVKRLCPVLDDPAPDCYCKNMNDRNLLLAVRFCINHFHQCDIFKRVHADSHLDPGQT